jgi:transposase
MNLLLQEIAGQVPQDRHAVVLIDNAGWHVTDKIQVPINLTLVNLPPYSPELNAIEQVWQYLRERYLSSCLFTDDAAILHACCDAWNRLLAETGRIRSLADRAWIYPVSP